MRNDGFQTYAPTSSFEMKKTKERKAVELWQTQDSEARFLAPVALDSLLALADAATKSAIACKGTIGG